MHVHGAFVNVSVSATQQLEYLYGLFIQISDTKEIMAPTDYKCVIRNPYENCSKYITDNTVTFKYLSNYYTDNSVTDLSY